MRRLWNTGKPDPEKLKRILRRFRKSVSPEVMVGPRYGEDAAVLDLGKDLLVVSSDPITFSSEDQGYYLVNVNANDIATMGAKPRFLLLVMLLPEGKTDPDLVEEILDQVEEAAALQGIEVVGGHTEVTPGLSVPILVGTMLGFVSRERLVTSSGGKPGDILLLTKGIAIEGTSIIAREKEEVAKRVLGKKKALQIKNWLFDPGISVVKEALLLVDGGVVSAMHDPTEGGLAMGIHELAEASSVGVEVDREKIPILPETQKLSEHFGIDPLGLIASGALLAAVPPSLKERALSLLRDEGIGVSEIGRLRERSFGVKMRLRGRLLSLPKFPQDEILRI